VGSVSKSLAPFLRLGWIACPSQLAHAVAREKRVEPGGQSG
jgi:GntR family transcriptional regulator / MocR family aminotransferase